jgi:hypothetical protein
MKVSSVSLSVIIAVITAPVLFGIGDSRANDRAGDPPAQLQSLTATRRTIPADTLAAINRCNCFTSVTAWQVNPIATPAEVFNSPDLLFAILDLDVQLPWVGVGEVGSKPLVDRILLSGVDALNKVLLLGNRSGGIRVGLYSWLHPTAPDFCSGETLHLLYFPSGGQLVAFRYDSSRDC